MQLRDREHPIAQCRDLADHVHALALLRGRIDALDRRTVAAEPLRGDAEAAEVELLELRPRLFRTDARRLEPLALARERIDIRRVRAARRVARRGLEQHGPVAGDRGLLEARLDRAARDSLVGEQVCGAHQHAEPRTARRERCGHRGDHRGRARIVDAAGEQDLELGDMLVGEQARDLLLPQHEAGARADVTTTLAALEHEAARAVLDEQIEEAGRRDVEIGRRALGLERRRLRRPATGDQGDRRQHVANHRELRLAHFLRHEAEDADAPRPIADQRLGLVEQLANLWPRHQREREERQAAALGNGRREARAITHARHRTLSDRIAKPVRARERRVRCERAMLGGEREVARDRALDAAHDLGGGQRARERGVLAERQQVHCEVFAAEAGDHILARLHLLPERQVRAREHAVAEQHRRLAAIHRRDRRAHGRGQRRLADEGELRIEHHADCATGNARGGGVLADPALRPHGHAEIDEALDEHERGLVTDPAAGLAALRDEAARTGRDRSARFLDGNDLREHAAPRTVQRHERWFANDHRRDVRGQLERDTLGNSHRGNLREQALRARWIATDIEHTECARGVKRGNYAEISALERGDSDDTIARLNHRHATTGKLPTETHRDRGFFSFQFK